MSTIKFWSMPNAGFESKKIIERELSLFHSSNPGITVEYEIFSWGRAWFKILNAIKEKKGPDVIQVGTTWIATLGYLGALHELDRCKFDIDSFIPSLAATGYYQNGLIALPWFCDSRVLFYRKDHLKDAGIFLKELETWDTLKLACLKLLRKKKRTSKYKAPLGFSGYKEQQMLQDIATWIWSSGGGFLNADGKTSALTRHETTNGLKLFLSLLSSGCIATSSLDQSAREACESFFLHDSNVFLISNAWPLQTYLNPSFKGFIGKTRASNFGIALVPSGSYGRFNFSGGSSLAITNFTGDITEPLALVKFLTSNDSLTRYCQKIRMLPSRKNSLIMFNDRETSDVIRQAIYNYGRSFTPNPLWGSLEQIILNGFAVALRDFCESGFDDRKFFSDINEINGEINNILSIFG
jgi:multiple sugar transport system substrate-binding protein